MLKIPERDKSTIVTAKPNSLTLDQAFAMFWKRYEKAMEQLSQK